MNYTLIYVFTVIICGFLSYLVTEYSEYKLQIFGQKTIFDYIKYFKEKYKKK